MSPLKLFRPLLALAAFLLFLPARGTSAEIEIPGIVNFVRVNERVFRGAQPEDHAWSKLSELGVKTVIDLRRDQEHSKTAEQKLVEAAGMKYLSFPMNGFDTPTADQMTKVLAMMDESGGPVFVHCKQGRDRTGTVVAAYRISREGWANDKALDEALFHGMHWYEKGMKQFLTAYKPEPLPAKLADNIAPATAAAPATVAPEAQATAPTAP